jgi:hypothetical protein
MFGRRQGSWRFYVWIMVAAVGLCAIFVGQRWIRPQRILAAKIASQLDVATSDALPDLMRQLAAFDNEGLPHLVSALKHARPEVASEARLALSEELDRWQLLKPPDASRRIEILARELARGIEACSPTTRRMASDLATRILLWPVDVAVVDQQQLIADCQRVLISVRGSETPTLVSMNVASVSPRSAGEDVSPLDEQMWLPGGGLPVEMTRAPTLPAEEQNQPHALPPNDNQELRPILGPIEEPRRFLPDAAPSDPRRTGDHALEQVYRLVSADSSERDAAEATLRKSGFSDAHLAVARLFADSRAEVRRDLVGQLARQAAVDARPWLLRLLVDDDTRVRMAAAKVLSTSGDPQIQRQLRQRAIEESDPDVRQALEQTAVQR